MKAIHWAGSALALLSCSALAQTPPPKADLAAGKARVEAVCAACHGANGVSVSDTIPNLAGQRVRTSRRSCAPSSRGRARTR